MTRSATRNSSTPFGSAAPSGHMFDILGSPSMGLLLGASPYRRSPRREVQYDAEHTEIIYGRWWHPLPPTPPHTFISLTPFLPTDPYVRLPADGPEQP